MVLLNNINSPKDLKKLSVNELPLLCSEIRDFLIHSLSKTGGHLASNLGTVELIVALHYVFESPNDKFCWDVGHQAYVHKILTGRKNEFNTLRSIDGLSGFPKIQESEHDHYNTGHAGTSISQALGEAKGRDLKLQLNIIDKPYSVVAITGDASIVSGLSFEAMNHAGEVRSPFLVLLNDNEMSISPNVGALNYTFSNLLSNKVYNRERKRLYYFITKIPIIGTLFSYLYKWVSQSLKGLLTNYSFFETLGFRFIGSIDGHNVINLVHIFSNLKNIDTPSILRVVTQKGKGYNPAEEDPVKYHGVKVFDINTGKMSSNDSVWSFSDFVGFTLSELVKKHKNLCVITPAMKEGSGLVEFANKHKHLFFDVGIAEQHAVTLAGAFAKTGLNPFLCIYSTFLQRGYDQLIHDIALMNLPVKIVIDRAGCVGGDGETHQGIYDIAFISCIPNVKLLTASNPLELIYMLSFMAEYNESPIAVRFPKRDFSNSYFYNWSSSCLTPSNWSPFTSDVVKAGKDIVIICEGVFVDIGLQVHNLLLKNNIESEVVSLKSIIPLDINTLSKSIYGKK